ncbi:ribosome biogenesis protein bop1, partial [Tachysurus ichikawai]
MRMHMYRVSMVILHSSGSSMDPTAKNRKLQKEKQKTEVDETGEKSVNPAGSSQVDEYDQDTSDEE